jgi:hypothetical protein
MEKKYKIPKYLSEFFAEDWVSDESRIHVLFDFLNENEKEIIFDFDLSAYRSDKCRGEIDGETIKIAEIENDGVSFQTKYSGPLAPN